VRNSFKKYHSQNLHYPPASKTNFCKSFAFVFKRGIKFSLSKVRVQKNEKKSFFFLFCKLKYSNYQLTKNKLSCPGAIQIPVTDLPSKPSLWMCPTKSRFEVSFLIRRLPVSTTKTLSLASTATLHGCINSLSFEPREPNTIWRKQLKFKTY